VGGQAVRMATVAPKAAGKKVGLRLVAEEGSERLRLHNLSPLQGSRKKKTRKGRGYGAGQVRGMWSYTRGVTGYTS
jgi:large subunit ribosomal protein L15